MNEATLTYLYKQHEVTRLTVKLQARLTRVVVSALACALFGTLAAMAIVSGNSAALAGAFIGVALAGLFLRLSLGDVARGKVSLKNAMADAAQLGRKALGGIDA